MNSILKQQFECKVFSYSTFSTRS